MDRAFSSGASGTPPSAPGSPSTGYATSGNPGTATPATKPGAYWYHMVTEELRALIVAAGLTPDHTNTSQIAQAVQAMIAAGAANDFKASVRAATTANIASLAGGAPNTLDGVALAANDPILVKDQTTGSQNGIYVVTTLGTGANGTWTRAIDADGASELTSGAIVPVEEGTTNADSQWMLTTDGTITIGATSLVFAKQGSGAALSSIVRYTSAGSGTYTKPGNVKKILIRAIGGGGGGAGDYGDFGAGGGGGSGGFSELFLSSPGSSYGYTVGAAGAAGAGSGGAGGAGGASTIAGISAGGGGGGYGQVGSGGVGGTSTGGDLNATGDGGDSGGVKGGTNANSGGGKGGSGFWGGGGKGGGNGGGYGGSVGVLGGGGGGAGLGGAAAAGGPGYIEIWEFI